ncbi:MAG: di-heme-cytochrome C peroxidase [Methylocystis sp.]|jgi:hypothetical protein
MFQAKSSFMSMIKSSAATLASIAVLATLPALADDAAPKFAGQGKGWSEALRKEFYGLDQGARIMPYSWIKALKHPDGTGFLDDALGRYGYLPNPDSETPGLPVGFLAAADSGAKEKTFSMTCAACHTRQIEIDGKPIRIDGGPAIVDFGSLLDDMDKALGNALDNDASFAEFAQAVLGSSPSEDARKQLRQDVVAWFASYDTLIQASLHPKPSDDKHVALPWGPARADCVGMIFNRVAGLDIGKTPNRIIAGNMAPADAPVRYPFVWNASEQDWTQWPGFAQNGDGITGLGRNVGEVFGVFGVFHPTSDPLAIGGVDYLADSSLQFSNLQRLENLIRQIKPPAWPGKIDDQLAAKGKDIFDRRPKDGGCGPGCHREEKGEARLCNSDTWKTPRQPVGTDIREYRGLGRVGDTGVLAGQIIPGLPFATLKSTDSLASVLKTSVAQSVIQAPLKYGAFTFAPILAECLKNKEANPLGAIEFLAENTQDILRQGLGELYKFPAASDPIVFESRVLHGVWATAPYLHNGSVPTLWELLKPPAARVSSFKIGPAYDLDNVGLAAEQKKFGAYELQTTADCGAGKMDDSGNSRCGHDYGTWLKEDEKRALLEYLKGL